MLIRHSQDDFLALKRIVENLNQPEQIDSHPWIESLFLQEAIRKNPALQNKSPGRQLAAAVSGLFMQMMPGLPPKRKKRLDPRWGEFGLLAAQYFSPFEFGLPFPPTMRDAWGKIDESILLFVQKKAGEALSEEEVARYSLIGDELEDAPASTMSDWHRKGLYRLLDIISVREDYLENVMATEKSNSNAERAGTSGKGKKGIRRRIFRIFILAALFLGLFLGGSKARRIYLIGQKLRGDMANVQELAENPSLDSWGKISPVLDELDSDLKALQEEAAPVFWITNKLGWVPVYGGDLASAQKLVALASLTVETTRELYTVSNPVVQRFTEKSPPPTIPEAVSLLFDLQPSLLHVQDSMKDVLSLRAEINDQQLSPMVRHYLVDDLDPLLSLMNDGLSLGIALPRILGATSEGPKTYLLLAENEDELRPTGGFITSVGNLVVQNGEIVSLSFENSGDDLQEDWSKPYPTAPWQLQDYMNSRVLILRDANWFPDYPTAALYAEYLYSYTHDHSVDGVIAFDQQMLVMLLNYLGPIDVEGAPAPINAENVVAYMRLAKVPSPQGFQQPGEERKAFIGKIADAVLTKMLNEGISDWEGLGKTFLRILNERHLLLQLDDETMTSLLAKYGWDGALHGGDGDFLTILDTNVGFNKTNANITRSISYSVDLTDISSPTSSLLVTHVNHSPANIPCIHWDSKRVIQNEHYYPIDRCYWNYLRVYLKEGASLIDATPQAIPGKWMILGKDVPARVDILEDDLDGLQGFGTLMVVPGGTSRNTSFDFALSPDVLIQLPDTNAFVYRLQVKKQPGTLAPPFTLRIHLPSHATVVSVPAGAIVQNGDVLIETSLQTDLLIEISFKVLNPN